MAKLEDLKFNTQVKGIDPSGPVTILNVKWHGSDVVEVTYRDIGGVNEHIFSCNRAAIDAEIERLRPLVELGGYIPCPDHRLPIEARWENVQYYCERMRQVFG